MGLGIDYPQPVGERVVGKAGDFGDDVESVAQVIS